MGWIFFLLGTGLFLAGLWLTGKFSAIANYSGIGGFRVTPGGLLYFLGVLMIIFGLCFFMVGTLFFL